MKVHLADSCLVISHEIVQLPLLFADRIQCAVEFRVVPVFSHAIIPIMLFLHILNPLLFVRRTLLHVVIPNLPLIHTL